jgi:hypothetical protein
MTDLVRVYVNGRGVDAPSTGTALDAVRIADANQAAAIERGERALTDSRGLPVEALSSVFAGAILRTVSNRNRRPDG